MYRNILKDCDGKRLLEGSVCCPGTEVVDCNGDSTKYTCKANYPAKGTEKRELRNRNFLYRVLEAFIKFGADVWTMKNYLLDVRYIENT